MVWNLAINIKISVYMHWFLFYIIFPYLLILTSHLLLMFTIIWFFSQAEHIKIAEECFHLVGSSSSECDTIHGRQCMAAAYFLAGQFEEVLVYLTSIKSYLHSGWYFLHKIYRVQKTFCTNIINALFQQNNLCFWSYNEELSRCQRNK